MGPVNKIFISAPSGTNGTALPSSAIPTDFGFACSFVIVSSSASNAGTLQIQGSNDTLPSLGGSATASPVNWVNAPGSTATATIAAGAINQVYLVPSAYPGYRWIRVVWTPTAANGNISVSGFVQTY